MPFDLTTAPAIAARRQRPVAVWLFALSGMILVMVTLGGATRLTGSGLSIMEWAPLMGALPPLSAAEWDRLYALYRHIPQYAMINEGFGLAGFKGIFWLEWTHRLWGRLMGVAFVLPLAWFAWRGMIGRRLGFRLLALLSLGGLQGAVGWVMVASGFEAARTSVSPYRLVVHLALAVTLYAAILWTALDVWRSSSAVVATRPANASPRRIATAALVSIALTILAGGFVAGLKAGLTYNSFPLMDGRLVPEGYWMLHPALRNLFENVATVQFDHRLLATLTACLALAAAWATRRGGRATQRAGAALGAAVLAQYALGVTTLLWAVPIALGVAHQAMAMLLLTSALVLVHLQWRSGSAEKYRDSPMPQSLATKIPA